MKPSSKFEAMHPMNKEPKQIPAFIDCLDFGQRQKKRDFAGYGGCG
jgi:hypothetical protein